MFLQDVLTSDAVVVEEAAALVLAQGTCRTTRCSSSWRPRRPTAGSAVIGAGDVLTPRTIEEAVLEGLRAGVAI